MATHPSILAWRIPWTEEPGRLQFMGSQRVRHDWVINTHNTKIHMHLWLLVYPHLRTSLCGCTFSHTHFSMQKIFQRDSHNLRQIGNFHHRSQQIICCCYWKKKRRKEKGKGKREGEREKERKEGGERKEEKDKKEKEILDPGIEPGSPAL